jgi:hypothetical protein
MSEASSTGEADETNADRLKTVLLVFRVVVVVAFLVAAAMGSSWAWPSALNAALLTMACFVALETTIFYLWAQGGSGDSDSNPYADAARVAITTQGVVLGLVAFQQGSLNSVATKVGACALVAGVLSALILYLNVVQGPPLSATRRFAVAFNLSLVMWALAFGLICVVAGSWA